MTIIKGVVDDLTIAPPADDPVLAQDPQLMGNRGAIDPGRGGEIAHAELARSERGQQTHTRRIAEDREEAGDIFSRRASRQSHPRGHYLPGMDGGNIAVIRLSE